MSFTRKFAWHNASDNDIKCYQQNIAIPASALQCRNSLCSDVSQLVMLNSYTCKVTEACLDAAVAPFPLLGLRMTVVVNACLGGLSWLSRIDKHLWVECDRSRNRTISDIMRRRRAKYDYVIRSVNRNKEVEY